MWNLKFLKEAFSGSDDNVQTRRLKKLQTFSQERLQDQTIGVAIDAVSVHAAIGDKHKEYFTDPDQQFLVFYDILICLSERYKRYQDSLEERRNILIDLLRLEKNLLCFTLTVSSLCCHELMQDCVDMHKSIVVYSLADLHLPPLKVDPNHPCYGIISDMYKVMNDLPGQVMHRSMLELGTITGMTVFRVDGAKSSNDADLIKERGLELLLANNTVVEEDWLLHSKDLGAEF